MSVPRISNPPKREEFDSLWDMITEQGGDPVEILLRVVRDLRDEADPSDRWKFDEFERDLMLAGAAGQEMSAFDGRRRLR